MSAYADLDLDSPRRKQRVADLKSQISALADDAMGRLDEARVRGRELASVSGHKAAAYAKSAAGQARRHPVSTGLIVAAVGVGLVFLLSRGARTAALTMGEDLWSRYGRR